MPMARPCLSDIPATSKAVTALARSTTVKATSRSLAALPKARAQQRCAAGAVNVRVTSWGGTSDVSLADEFTYV